MTRATTPPIRRNWTSPRPDSSVGDLLVGLWAAGVDVHIRGDIGDTADAILQTIADPDSDICVLDGRRRSPTGNLVFGSPACEVMMNAPRPVLHFHKATQG